MMWPRSSGAVFLLLITIISAIGVLRIAIALIGGTSSLSAALTVGSFSVGIALGGSAVTVCVRTISFGCNLLCSITCLIFSIPIAAAQFVQARVVAGI